jgi:hypothetical protein
MTKTEFIKMLDEAKLPSGNASVEKYEEAIQKLDFMNDEYNKLLECYKLSGGFGNWYLVVKRVLKECQATEKELEAVLKKADEQYRKDSNLISLLESRNEQLKKAYGELQQSVQRYFSDHDTSGEVRRSMKMIDIEQAKKSLSNMIDEYNVLLERYKLSGGFGNWYIHVKKALTELEQLQKKETPMKPIIDDNQPYCPICKTDLYHGRGIMDKYTDYYCIKCGQLLDRRNEMKPYYNEKTDTYEFNSLDEMKSYYNEKTDTYEFGRPGHYFNVKFNFGLNTNSHINAWDINARDINVRDIKACDIKAENIKAENIKAWDIDAWNINAWNIDAWNINAWDINVRDIKAENIKAENIKAENINARDINARDINARDIKAYDTKAENIKAWDINARDINAWNIDAWNIKAYDIKAYDIKAYDISYYAMCFAYKNIKCASIQGRRENAKHFVLDGEIEIVARP